jgi:hypothetical protein
MSTGWLRCALKGTGVGGVGVVLEGRRAAADGVRGRGSGVGWPRMERPNVSVHGEVVSWPGHLKSCCASGEPGPCGRPGCECLCKNSALLRAPYDGLAYFSQYSERDLECVYCSNVHLGNLFPINPFMLFHVSILGLSIALQVPAVATAGMRS